MNEIVLNGPGKNCLSNALLDQILERLREASGGPILLTGAGDAFCAGLDLNEVASFDAVGIEAFLRKLEALVKTLYTYPGPTVALINGHAIAGGCILALCCDYQVAQANPKIKIGLNELALGLRFPPITLSVLRDRLPKRHLNQVLLGAGLHDPAAALRLGLIDEVSDNAAQVARARLQLLASYPVEAYLGTKTQIRGDSIDEATHEEDFREMLATWTSSEMRARLAAMLKR